MPPYLPEIPKRPGLPPHLKEIEQRAIDYVREHFDELVSSYYADPYHYTQDESRALILAADAVKPRLPGFQTPAEASVNSSAVHEAAKAVTDYIAKVEYAKSIVGGKDVIVLVAGSPGSGKTTSSQIANNRYISLVRETIFTTPEKAERQVREILAAGKRPAVTWVYIDKPGTTLLRAALRANGIGRTVPIEYMAGAYASHAPAIEGLRRMFGSTLTIHAIDNSGAEANLVPIDTALQAMAGYKITTVKENMHAELNRLESEGRISSAAAKGFRFTETDANTR